jgi:hypothetical protein
VSPQSPLLLQIFTNTFVSKHSDVLGFTVPANYYTEKSMRNFLDNKRKRAGKALQLAKDLGVGVTGSGFDPDIILADER